MSSEGRLLHVSISPRRGVPKRPVPDAVLEPEHGIAGDAHAGRWHRQLSLLDGADIAEMARAAGLALQPGDFGENFVVEGLDLARLGIGTILGIGEARIEITQIGKVCHERCAIYEAAGDCIMPRFGLFARVVRGGPIAPDQRVKVIELVSRETIQAAVLTASDRCSRGEAEDTAGPAVARRIEDALGARIAWAGIAPDEAEEISSLLRDVAGRGLDLVLTVGGTGCAPRDVTPEATRAVIEKEAPGLAEAMRSASSRVTPRAFLSRAVCGIYRRTLILNLPGSEKAAVENIDAIIDILPHAIEQIRGEGGH